MPPLGFLRFSKFQNSIFHNYRHHLFTNNFPLKLHKDKMQPSTYKICRFTKLEASDARNTVGSIKSCGFPIAIQLLS